MGRWRAARTLPQASELVLRQEAAQHHQLIAAKRSLVVPLARHMLVHLRTHSHRHRCGVLALELLEVIAQHRGEHVLLILDGIIQLLLQFRKLSAHARQVLPWSEGGDRSFE
jgi:hypothetical protein